MTKPKSEMRLGDRMKMYEEVKPSLLLSRVPVIIRVDGKAFHSYCRKLNKPFDLQFMGAMDKAAIALCKEIQGAKLAYIQSDEISVLLTDYDTLYQTPWMGYVRDKMVSISASCTTANFNMERYIQTNSLHWAMFDSRVFNCPIDEVCNYFIWRQQDTVRNSIHSLARSLYSQKQLQGKNSSELQELCFVKGHNWNDLDASIKRGRCVVYNSEVSKWEVDSNIPTFTQDREYVEKYI